MWEFYNTDEPSASRKKPLQTVIWDRTNNDFRLGILQKVLVLFLSFRGLGKISGNIFFTQYLFELIKNMITYYVYNMTP